MPIINNNKYMLDRPMWEQLSFAPVTGTNGDVGTRTGLFPVKFLSNFSLTTNLLLPRSSSCNLSFLYFPSSKV